MYFSAIDFLTAGPTLYELPVLGH